MRSDGMGRRECFEAFVFPPFMTDKRQFGRIIGKSGTQRTSEQRRPIYSRTSKEGSYGIWCISLFRIMSLYRIASFSISLVIIAQCGTRAFSDA